MYHIVVVSRELLEQGKLRQSAVVAKRSLTGSITLRSGTSRSDFSFNLYRFVLFLAVNTFYGGKSAAYSSYISEYVFLLALSLEMSVGGRSLGDVDRAPVLYAKSTNIRYRSSLSDPTFTGFLVSFLTLVATDAKKSLSSNLACVTFFTRRGDRVASSIFRMRRSSKSAVFSLSSKLL